MSNRSPLRGFQVEPKPRTAPDSGEQSDSVESMSDEDGEVEMEMERGGDEKVGKEGRRR